MGGVVHIPWYGTGFRADRLEAALGEVAAVSLRYGATAYSVHRSRDDRYKFLQLAYFERKLDWERYWAGPEVIEFRVRCSSWYQIPVLYVWHDEVVSGALSSAEREGEGEPAPVANGG